MSSFRKRVPASQVKYPPGTRLNTHNAQLLVSTGVPSLDDLLGGGLPVGGVLLVEEDRQTSYSDTLLSYFASQAIAASHELCIVSADSRIDLQAQLPGWAAVSRDSTNESRVETKCASSEEDNPNDTMKIAWRYRNLPKIGADGESADSANNNKASRDAGNIPFCESFDLTMRIPQEVIDRSKVHVIDGPTILSESRGEAFGGDMYKMVLNKISSLIENGYSSLKPPPPGTERSVLRVELRSLGSGFWQGADSHSILRFMHGLRGLLRYSYAACVISLPAHLYEDETGERLPIVRRIEHLSDAVIELESFEGKYATPADIVARQIKTESSPQGTQEYHGFLHIHKLPCLNSLTAATGKLSLLNTGSGSANNLAFRLRRKKFSIETYHLPIEGGVTERRVPDQKSTKKKTRPNAPGAGCGSRPGHTDPLEF